MVRIVLIANIVMEDLSMLILAIVCPTLGITLKIVVLIQVSDVDQMMMAKDRNYLESLMDLSIKNWLHKP